MKKTFIAVAIAAGLSASMSANATIIDLFNTPQTTIRDDATVVPDAIAVFSQAGPAADIIGGALNGYRDLGVQTKASPDGTELFAKIGVVGGALRFSTDTDTKGTGMVRWDGEHAAASFSDADTTGLGGLNIGSAIGSFFKLDILFADAGFDFVLTAWTDDDNWSSVKVTSLAHSVPGVSYIPYLAFLDCDNADPTAITTCAGSPGDWHPVDFSSIGALEALIDPLGTYTALDLSINAVTTVPEPASLALVGLGLLGLGGIRRRRNSK